MTAAKYARLSGRSYGISGISRLWLGEGHVLEVSSALAFERYRRWYLRDLQILFARRSGKRMAWNLVWGIVAGAMLGIAGGLLGLSSVGGESHQAELTLRGFAALSGAIGLAGAALMLVNTLLGATCTVYIQTPRGVTTLAAPTRQRAFEKLLARLGPHISSP